LKLVEDLRDAELQDGQVRELTIFGGAAILLWVDDAMSRFTDDVDVDGNAPSSKLIRFQGSSIQNFLIHPDWRADRLKISNELELRLWEIYLVNPVDLVVLKLGRWLDRDYADASLLVSYFGIESDLIVERLEEAWSYYATDNQFQRTKIRNGFQDLFERELSEDALPVRSIEDYTLSNRNSS